MGKWIEQLVVFFDELRKNVRMEQSETKLKLREDVTLPTIP